MNLQSQLLAREGASAKIFSHGAHVADFRTAGGDALLFLSAQSQFETGKPIRGGVPLIFPWFGANKGDSALPMHGFARTMEWRSEPGNDEYLDLVLESNAETLALWPHPFRLNLRVEIEAERLRLSLEIHNTGDAAFEFETALHTYFCVSDVRNISIEGFDGKTYLDKTQNMARQTQRGAIQITGETDRVYLNSNGPISLHDGGRTVQISSLGGVKSSVVWNPWIEKARALADLGDGEWPSFVCIESGVIADDAERLEAGGSYQMAVQIEFSGANEKNAARL